MGDRRAERAVYARVGRAERDRPGSVSGWVPYASRTRRNMHLLYRSNSVHVPHYLILGYNYVDPPGWRYVRHTSFAIGAVRYTIRIRMSASGRAHGTRGRGGRRGTRVAMWKGRAPARRRARYLAVTSS